MNKSSFVKHICKYMIIYICVYVCMYACMYVCMYACVLVGVCGCKSVCRETEIEKRKRLKEERR